MSFGRRSWSPNAGSSECPLGWICSSLINVFRLVQEFIFNVGVVGGIPCNLRRLGEGDLAEHPVLGCVDRPSPNEDQCCEEGGCGLRAGFVALDDLAETDTWDGRQ